MNLSIPPSLVPDVLRRRKQLSRVKDSMPTSGVVPISSIPPLKADSVAPAPSPVAAAAPRRSLSPSPSPPPSGSVIAVTVPADISTSKSAGAATPCIDRCTSSRDLAGVSVAELKRWCGEHKLSKVGRRSQLVQRVLEHVSAQRKAERAEKEGKDGKAGKAGKAKAPSTASRRKKHHSRKAVQLDLGSPAGSDGDDVWDSDGNPLLEGDPLDEFELD